MGETFLKLNRDSQAKLERSRVRVRARVRVRVRVRVRAAYKRGRRVKVGRYWMVEESNR